MKIIIGLVVAAFLLGPMVSSADAQGPEMMQGPGEHGMPHEHMDDEGFFWIDTDIITIMANGHMPSLHFWFTADANGSTARFSASYLMLTEFEDLNMDGAFQSDEVLYHAP
ncbi:MAG: hypothetical protein ACW992_11875, partial [Candidatus Thorarchaeota archaeon]